MRLHERLLTLVSALRDDDSFTVTTETLRGWLDEDEEDSGSPGAPTVESKGDHLLTVDEVAESLAVERTWVYRHAGRSAVYSQAECGDPPLFFERSSAVAGVEKVMSTYW